MVTAVTGKRLTLGEHLEELRRRLIYFLIFLVIAIASTFAFQEQIMHIIRKPHDDIMLLLNLPPELYAFGYPEKFMAYFKLNIIAALILAAPFGLWQMWCFISAGLYQKERRIILTYLPLSLVLFIMGVLFGYHYLLPPAFQFLASYGDNEHIKIIFNIDGYLSLFVILTLALGLSFELPLVMLFFSAIGLASPQTYLRKIRLAILLIFIFSAAITPTSDAITMTLFALPLVGLYLLGIILSWLSRKNSVTSS